MKIALEYEKKIVKSPQKFVKYQEKTLKIR